MRTYNIDSRAIIAIVMLISVFVEMPVLMYLAFANLPTDVALEFIRWTFAILLAHVGYILGYFFSAKNSEKKIELQQNGKRGAKVV